MLEKQNLSYDQSGHLSKLVQNYLKKHPQLKAFSHFDPDENGLARAMEVRKEIPVNRDLLVKVLLEQHADFESGNAALRENILSIKQGNTFTVTTGHQLCLFTGPLYFIYKIVTVIRLTEELRKRYKDYNFVPVFWMASEDHDFDEINHAHIYGKTLSWERDQQGAVGRMQTDSLTPVVEELEALISREEKAGELMKFFKEAYLKSKDLSAATRLVVQELFQKDGVVVLDADHPELKREMLPVIERDLFTRITEQSVISSSNELQELGYKTPVVPRPINFFYLKEGLRERIVPKNGGFEVLNTDITFSETEMRTEMEANPERFSPNVVLRPVYQETILPNLAYIGGPSEVAYWLQLCSTFVEHQTFFPVVLPRNFAMVIPLNLRKKMEKLDLTPEQLYGDTAALVTEKVKKEATSDLDLNREKKELETFFNTILDKLNVIDPSLKGAAEGEKQKALKGLAVLETKMVRAEKRKHETTVNQIHGLKDKLFPGGTPQERWDSIIPFYLRWGTKFIRELKGHFDPLDYRMNVLLEEPEKD